MNHKITSIQKQKRNPKRVNVYLDGDFAFGLSRIVAAWLRVGQELNEEKIKALKEEDNLEVVYQQALKFVGYSMRTEAEVQEKLHGGDFPEHVIDEVIVRLRQSGLVDDERFATLWVENRNDFRPRSHRALVYELRRKGIPDQLITKTLTGTVPEEELAYRAALRHSGKLRELDRSEFRRKLGGFLTRRGFPYDIIAPVVDRVWTELRSIHLGET